MAITAFFNPGSATSSHSSMVGWAANTWEAYSDIDKLLHVLVALEMGLKAAVCAASSNTAVVIENTLIVNVIGWKTAALEEKSH